MYMRHHHSGHRQRDRDTVELLEDLVRQQLLSVCFRNQELIETCVEA